eukprot:4554414-Amphidinium_carterae.1
MWNSQLDMWSRMRHWEGKVMSYTWWATPLVSRALGFPLELTTCVQRAACLTVRPCGMLPPAGVATHLGMLQPVLPCERCSYVVASLLQC